MGITVSNNLSSLTSYPTQYRRYHQGSNMVIPFSKVPRKPTWNCASCTYENGADCQSCNMCGKIKPVSVFNLSEKNY